MVTIQWKLSMQSVRPSWYEAQAWFVMKMAHSCWGLAPGQVHPRCLSVRSRWQVSEASSPPAVGWIIRLQKKKRAELWQLYGSVAGKHHIHAAVINAHIVLPAVKGAGCIFLPFPSSSLRGGLRGLGPPRHCAQLECTNPGEGGREGGGGTPRWVGGGSGGGALQTTEGLKAVSGENAQGDTEIWSPTVWCASLPQPWTLSWTRLIFPTMKSDLADQRAQVNGQEQSNCLSPWYASANRSYRSVQQWVYWLCAPLKSAFVSVSVSGLKCTYCMYAHMLKGGNMLFFLKFHNALLVPSEEWREKSWT